MFLPAGDMVTPNTDTQHRILPNIDTQHPVCCYNFLNREFSTSSIIVFLYPAFLAQAASLPAVASIGQAMAGPPNWAKAGKNVSREFRKALLKSCELLPEYEMIAVKRSKHSSETIIQQTAITPITSLVDRLLQIDRRFIYGNMTASDISLFWDRQNIVNQQEHAE